MRGDAFPLGEFCKFYCDKELRLNENLAYRLLWINPRNEKIIKKFGY